MAQTITFPLDREFIALNDLLKLAGVCDSGGAGKALVVAGEVSVDGGVTQDREDPCWPGGRRGRHRWCAHQGGGSLNARQCDHEAAVQYRRLINLSHDWPHQIEGEAASKEH